MNATDKARDLGTEHGTRAAEVWLAEPYRQTVSKEAWDYLLVCLDLGDRSDLPRPDLSDPATCDAFYRECGATLSADLGECGNTYAVAFTAAVEATIRAKCEVAS